MAFQIIRNDITKVAADAIVNTANPQVYVGAGVDYAIYEAAGREQLLRARAEIGELAIGEVAITPAFALPARYIIHESGPIWVDGQHGESEMLRQCYRRCLEVAEEYGCRSIAFPLISTGAYGFPKEVGLRIATDTFCEFLLEHEMEITLVVFSEYAYKISGRLFENVQSFVDENYVGAALEKESEPDWGEAFDELTDTAAEMPAMCPKPSLAPEPSEKDGLYRKLKNKIFHSREAAREEKTALYHETFGGSSPQMNAAPVSEKNAASAPMPQVSEPKMSAAPSLSIDDLLKQMYTDSFEKHLQQLINKKGMKNSEVYTAANISKQYFSKLMKGAVKPSKEKVLSLAVGLRLNVDETIDFLRIAGYALSPVSQTDVIVEYFIRKQDYNVMRIDIVLFDYGLPLLSE